MRTVCALLLMILSVRTTSSQDFMNVNIFSELSKITTLEERIKTMDEEINQLKRQKEEQLQTLEALCRNIANSRIDELLPTFQSDFSALKSQMALVQKAASFYTFVNIGPKFYVSDGHLMTFEEGLKWCQDAGGRLALPRNYAENQMLAKVLKKFGSVYMLIGATDRKTEGQWLDTKSSAVNFFSWSKGEPNNYGGYEHCVITGEDGLWSDITCEKRYVIACELD